MDSKNTGKFVISLDFELLWGVRDKKTIESYGKNILGVWESLPRIVEQFEEKKVKATFATVGFLFASNKKELMFFCPKNVPQYTDSNLSPYNGHIAQVEEMEELDQYHYASSLIELLKKYPSQEIATHTFSHYYCLEEGQTEENFKDDINAAIKIAENMGITLKSLVFPRNQYNEKYLNVLKELGISSYRGNESQWYYKPANRKDQKLTKRFFRLLDTYINLSGHNCYRLEKLKEKTPYNIPSSRFLRPFSPKLKVIEGFRLKRILNGMTHAAKNNSVYHLWWHPHNFGSHQKENFAFLDKILQHYSALHAQYGFESMTMGGLSEMLAK